MAIRAIKAYVREGYVAERRAGQRALCQRRHAPFQDRATPSSRSMNVGQRGAFLRFGGQTIMRARWAWALTGFMSYVPSS